MKPKDIKFTTRINKEIFDCVNNNLHYGQQEKLFRNIFSALKILIQEERFDDITDFMYKEEPLMLPSITNSNEEQRRADMEIE